MALQALNSRQGAFSSFDLVFDGIQRSCFHFSKPQYLQYFINFNYFAYTLVPSALYVPCAPCSSDIVSMEHFVFVAICVIKDTVSVL